MTKRRVKTEVNVMGATRIMVQLTRLEAVTLAFAPHEVAAGVPARILAEVTIAAQNSGYSVHVTPIRPDLTIVEVRQ